MAWQEITVSVTRAAGELLTVVLQDLGVGGAVMHDPALNQRYKDRGGWEYSDLETDQGDSAAVHLSVYLPAEADPNPVLGQIRVTLQTLAENGVEPGEGTITFGQVREEDWATAWKAYYKPTPVGEKLLIRPSWEECALPPGRREIVLDPGMAFGTGTHPTTVLCLQALERQIRGGETVYDIGTGSGILAIGAAVLGAARVVGVDIDPVAVRVARENCELNGVSNRVEVREGDIRVLAGEAPATVVVANIIADVIIAIADGAANLLRPRGVFIASGIIRERYPEVKDRLTRAGLAVTAEATEGEWVALTAVRE